LKKKYQTRGEARVKKLVTMITKKKYQIERKDSIEKEEEEANSFFLLLVLPRGSFFFFIIYFFMSQLY